jgi:Ni/Co efflux regulator RcnB
MGAVNRRPTLLARLASAAGACAVLLASPALAQDRHPDRDDYRGGRWSDRGAPREDRREPPRASWDERRYNGYWLGPHWHYGPPQGPAYETPGFRPGFVPWRRGAWLPPQYRAYVLNDYARYHLRRPPYGYAWVQIGGECLLISLATGQIFDVVTY